VTISAEEIKNNPTHPDERIKKCEIMDLLKKYNYYSCIIVDDGTIYFLNKEQQLQLTKNDEMQVLFNRVDNSKRGTPISMAERCLLISIYKALSARLELDMNGKEPKPEQVIPTEPTPDSSKYKDLLEKLKKSKTDRHNALARANDKL
jgi:hypothetical protein